MCPGHELKAYGVMLAAVGKQATGGVGILRKLLVFLLPLGLWLPPF